MRNIQSLTKSATLTVVIIGLLISTNLFSQEADLSSKIVSNDLEGVKELIAAGADINQLEEMSGFTPLLTSIHYNSVEIAKFLISKGADINAQEKNYGYTALILACNYNYADMAKLLIASGADINIKGKDGSTALMAACYGSEELVTFLLSKGADVNSTKPDGTGVFTACISGILMERVTMDLAKALLSKGLNVDEAATSGPTKGYTPLMMAARSNQAELVRFLIKNGANVNAVTGDGNTALTLATKDGNEKIVEILKSNGSR